jgi:NAD(P)H-hydrate repair Nnr-like enzyme with NAD(P)H-hydrate epimerase domain
MGAALVCAAKFIFRIDATSAWTISQQLIEPFNKNKIQKIAIWCGQGNNAGDGYYIAAFLKQHGFHITVYAAELGQSLDLKQAVQYALLNRVDIQSIDYLLSENANHQEIPTFDCHIDALFGMVSIECWIKNGSRSSSYLTHRLV